MRKPMDAKVRYGSLVRVLGGLLGLVSMALAGCGDYDRLLAEAVKHGSGKHDPKPGASDGGAPKPDGGALACVDLAFDHDVVCEDMPQAKDQAWAECRKRTLELTKFGPGSCLAGDLVRLQYSCCPKPEEPPPTPAGPFAPKIARYAQYTCCASPTECLIQQLGGDSVCKDAAAFEAEAAAACATTGGTLTNVGLYVACSL